MNEQEAQQAQTIADARKWAAEESAWLSRQKLPQSESVEHMDGVLQIVDSQAQKIAEQAKALNDCETRNVKLNQQNDKLRDALAEQAERVKQRV